MTARPVTAPPAAPRHFDAAYTELARLRDGTEVELRLTRAEDKDLLRTGFERLSPRSRYARFLSPKTHLTHDELRYLTEVDQENHFAMGAVRHDPDGPVGVGIARFIRLPGLHATAEAAIAVADEVHGRGLGRLLFVRLCAAAAERGIEHFRCEVLGSNNSMRGLIEEVSPDCKFEVGGGVMSIDMLLPDVTPTEPHDDTPAPAGPMYRLFRAAAQNMVEWGEAMRRLFRSGGDEPPPSSDA